MLAPGFSCELDHLSALFSLVVVSLLPPVCPVSLPSYLSALLPSRPPLYLTSLRVLLLPSHTHPTLLADRRCLNPSPVPLASLVIGVKPSSQPRILALATSRVHIPPQHYIKRQTSSSPHSLNFFDRFCSFLLTRILSSMYTDILSPSFSSFLYIATHSHPSLTFPSLPVLSSSPALLAFLSYRAVPSSAPPPGLLIACRILRHPPIPSRDVPVPIYARYAKGHYTCLCLDTYLRTSWMHVARLSRPRLAYTALLRQRSPCSPESLTHYLGHLFRC
ncbi:hypothetical protein R3P38DRAFT_1631129 [Favolaschia claudopus]|uniref:Uncharacterized protein n=1 Tax=Favolaschia claudopus TaxID=2862362 RepID=A0AAW0DJ64_9AGAR